MNCETPLAILTGETERVNPAILLAEEFMRRDAADLLSAEDVDRAEEVLKEGRMEIETIRLQIAAFVRSSPSPSIQTPTGF
ncbi:MAG TPA: hypothetical protein VK612_00645 [Pyrinomonadaceae bacterium]|nr:hypothetical protein [Pyrinomonadaceae bacterium]